MPEIVAFIWMGANNSGGFTFNGSLITNHSALILTRVRSYKEFSFCWMRSILVVLFLVGVCNNSGFNCNVCLPYWFLGLISVTVFIILIGSCNGIFNLNGTL